MINLAVINLKTLLKGIMKIISIIIIMAMVIKFTRILYCFGKNINFDNIELSNSIKIIKDNVKISNAFEENKENESNVKKILVGELAVFLGAEEKMMEKENQEEIIEFEEVKESENNMEYAKENIETTNEIQAPIQSNETMVIEKNNKKDVYTDIYQSVQIKNESDYSLTEEMLKPNINYKNTKDIIVYHTHTCESYTATENSQYISTGNYRTTDLNYSVARVGTELANNLAVKGYSVIHDQTYHDYPAYTGSYTRSLATIKNLLETYNTVDVVFDIHRDALRK